MGAYAQLAGIPIVEARVSFPRIGAWTADVRVDTDATLSGSQVLQLGNARFVCSIVSAGILKASLHAKLIAGKGGLKNELPSKGYTDAPVLVPLQDIATEAGESLSPATERSVTGVQLAHWARTLGAAGQALDVLLRAVPGAVWRFLPSGELWVGLETWPASNLATELTDYEPFADRIEFFSLTPGVLPGTTFLGRRASYVEHQVSESRLQTSVWFEAST